MPARAALAHLPTPLEALPRLSAALGGPRLFIKRDDQTGLAGGGNKTRKLEFLMAEALAKQADTVLTQGGPQSNHCRQTAAAAARLGLRCVLVLGGCPPAQMQGNILLDRLLGAHLVWAGERPRAEALAEAAEAERAAGRQPYVIPLGGSTALGAVGYALAMIELAAQAETMQARFDSLVFASSSGGTQAGLRVGADEAGFGGQILGISIDQPPDDLRAHTANLASQAASLLGRPREYAASDMVVNADYLGLGYGRMGDAEREAIELFARCEGILLDPVYTGRAAAGLIDLIRRGEWEREAAVLFWHTGGAPALFAYGEELLMSAG